VSEFELTTPARLRIALSGRLTLHALDGVVWLAARSSDSLRTKGKGLKEERKHMQKRENGVATRKDGK
jgi:hypothetical protein